MSLLSIGLIVVGILGAILAVILFSKGDDKNKKNANSAENVNPNVAASPTVKSTATNSGKKVIQKNDKNIPRKDMFDFMEFDRIADNMIIQNKKSSEFFGTLRHFAIYLL